MSGGSIGERVELLESQLERMVVVINKLTQVIEGIVEREQQRLEAEQASNRARIATRS